MTKRGFTLLEVIIATFLITTGVIGSLLAIQKVISLTSISSSRLIAAYLAQEGIEVVRNIRDGNWLEQQTNPGILWNDGLAAGEWEADYKSSNLTQIYQGNYLKVDNSGFYSYSSAAPLPPCDSYGDINDDGLVTYYDDLMLIIKLWGKPVTDEQTRRADVNGSGFIDMDDFTAVSAYSACSLNNFPKVCPSGSKTFPTLKFKRKITVTPAGSDILKVSVWVNWEERGSSFELTAQENLYNWR